MESGQDEVRVECSSQVLKNILTFLYSGKLTIGETTPVMELLEQSKMRGLEALEKGVHWAVMNFLANDLDEELTDISDDEGDDGNSSDIDESNVTGRVYSENFRRGRWHW